MNRHLIVLIASSILAPIAHAHPKPAESLREYVAKNARRHAAGLYLLNRKVGWIVIESRLGTHDGKEVALSTSEMELTFRSDRESNHVRRKSLTVHSLDDGSIVYASEKTEEDKAVVEFVAVRDGNRMKVTEKSNNRENVRRVSIPKETLEISRRLDAWLSAIPAKGAKFETWTTSWDKEAVDVKEVVTFKDKRSIVWGGVPAVVYHVSINANGAELESEILADGTPLKAKIGGLIEIRAETEEIAKKIDANARVDMMAISSIKPSGPSLGRASRVTSMTLEVTGAGEFDFPSSHRQKATRNGSALTLVLRRDFRIEKPAPLAKDEREKFLAATPTVQCTDPAIQALAKKIVGDEKDKLKKADVLRRWVYRNIRKTMAANATTALAVIDQKAGDCTEHSLIFVALARAAGVPAREVTGVAYVEQDEPIFGWHAWAEIHDGHQWVSVDPTWNQLYVDATHVVFANNIDDMTWLNVLGKAKFKIVSFDNKK